MKRIVLLRHGAEHLEQGEPVYRLDGRRPHARGCRRSRAGRRAAPRRRLHLRKSLYLLPQTGGQDTRLRAGQAGRSVDSGRKVMAASTKNTTECCKGLNKSETAEKYGEEQVHVWRRSYDVAPDPLPEDDPRNPRFDVRYACVPDGRTAAHRIARTDDRTHPALLALRRLPVADAVRQPSGRRTRQFAARRHQASQRNPRRPDRRAQPADGPVPYVFEFDDALRLVRDYYLGDPEEIRRRAEAVARQGSAR